MGDWLFGWFYELLYILQKSICYLLDFIRQIFCKLAGIETVAIDGEQTDLLTHFVLSDGVKNAFLGVFLIGVILLFIFVMIAIIKSETADAQHKRTKGQILVKAGQSFVIFILIPFLLLAGITLVNAIMTAINGSMSGAMTDGNFGTSLGGQILVTSGHGAYVGPSGSRAEIERMFATGQLDYNNLDVVKQYYDLGDVNFFVGIGGSLVILIMFVMSAVMFVQRIFDIILLYIVSPASVATIPLDDGGRFRIWREMLVSKVLGAYGIILSMNLFFLIIPQVAHISFFGDGFKDGIVQLLFVLGGAFSITKANMVISQLTGSNAGAQEAQQMLSSIHSGVRMMRTAGHVAAGAAGMVVGGTDFLRNSKRGMSLSDNLSQSIHSQRNQKQTETGDDKDKKNGGNGPGNDSPPSGGSGGTHSPDNGTTVIDAARNSGANAQSGENANAANADNTTADARTAAESSVSEAAATDVQDTTKKASGENPKAETNDNVAETAKNGKHNTSIGSVVKGATRLASLPAGIMKDLIQGGVIVAGKNFIPRVKNVLQGNSIVNHADVHRKPAKTNTAAAANKLADQAAKETK